MVALVLAFLTLFVPLGIAMLLMVAAPLRRAGWPAVRLSVAGAVVALGAATLLFFLVLGHDAPGEPLVRVAAEWLPHASLAKGSAHGESPIQLGLLIDGISASMLLVVCFVAAMVQIFSIGYMSEEPPADLGRYFTWQSLFLFAMNSLVLAPNLLQLFLGWELVGLASYLLIGFWYKKPSAAKAAVKAFWTTKLADMGLVLGLIVLFVHAGTFEWTAETPVAGWVTFLIFIAVMGKSAQFPLHVWLPDAMEGPTPVSALLHAATMVAAGVFLVVRADPLFDQADATRAFMTYIGAFTALFAASVAVVQRDIKKVLAYSTCSQLGYMVAALGVGGQAAGFFHLTTHAFFKALLFLAAGGLIHAVHSNDIFHMGGLLKKMRWTGTTFIIGALALAGLPGLSGFFSKDLVLEEVLHHGAYVPLLFLLAAVFLTAFYMGRVIVIALLGEPSEHAKHAHESGPTMTFPLVALAVPALFAGFFGATLSGLYGEPVHFHVTAFGVFVSLLGLSGLGIAFLVFGPKKAGQGLLSTFAPVGSAVSSSAIDRFYEHAYRRWLGGVARTIGFVDRYIIDGAVNGVAYACVEAGQRLRRTQTGNVSDYVYAVAMAAVLLGLFGALQGS